MEGADGAGSAWVAGVCDRASGQELSPEEEQRPELVQAAITKELDAWGKFDACERRKDDNVSGQVAQTRWVLTWKVADGRKSAVARLVAKGRQDPDIQNGIAGTSGCVRLRSPHLQVISRSVTKKWKLWSLDIKTAFRRLLDSTGTSLFRHQLDGGRRVAPGFRNSWLHPMA